MYQIDWAEWDQFKLHKERHRQEQKGKIRELLESETKSINISLKKWLDMLQDDTHHSDSMDIMEEALMNIADGRGDPKEVAVAALKRIRGED